MCGFIGVIINTESCTSVVDHLKEEVMKIQQRNTWKGLANFKKDQEYIKGLQVKINALVSMIHTSQLFFII